MADLLTLTDRGLYSPQGEFYIDPWLPVERAVITHAHADHARPGSHAYLTATSGVDLVRERVGLDATVEGLPYGEPREINGVRLSLHPAGHVLGSAQVRLESSGQVWVVTGDYKTAADNTCEPMEPLVCHTLVTESTFALPVFRRRTRSRPSANWPISRLSRQNSRSYSEVLLETDCAACGRSLA